MFQNPHKYSSCYLPLIVGNDDALDVVAVRNLFLCSIRPVLSCFENTIGRFVVLCIGDGEEVGVGGALADTELLTSSSSPLTDPLLRGANADFSLAIRLNVTCSLAPKVSPNCSLIGR